MGHGDRPPFVKPDRVGNHTAIPIFKAPPADPKAVSEELYAVCSSPSAFKLESRGHTVAEFELPAYGNWLTTKKFFLFPLAAAADAVGVGAAAAAEGAFRSGLSIPVR